MPSPTSNPDAPPAANPSTGPLLVCLPSLSSGALSTLRESLAAALPSQPVRLATPDAASTSDSDDDISLVAYPAGASAHDNWALSAADYLVAADLIRQHNAPAALLLGAEAVSLSPAALHALATPVLSGYADLALPRYTTGPHDALLSSALLYPLTYALFGGAAHLPLPLDAAFSARMAARLSVLARRPSPNAEASPLLWPVAEALTASLVFREIDAGDRTLPHPPATDLNAILTQVAGSLFADIETRASFWQRARPTLTAAPRVASPFAASVFNASSFVASPFAHPPHRGATSEASQNTLNSPEEDSREDSSEDSAVAAMASDFSSAFHNLQEIWSLVLPPQSLLALKKASEAPTEDFELSPTLWARIAYDFVLAWHLRTINRGHLLGSLTPLYLAWVASHLKRAAGDTAQAANHVEQTAAAFVSEKPYILARWRWPDRFNP